MDSGLQLQTTTFGPCRIIGMRYVGDDLNNEIGQLWAQFCARIDEIDSPGQAAGFGVCRCGPCANGRFGGHLHFPRGLNFITPSTMTRRSSRAGSVSRPGRLSIGMRSRIQRAGKSEWHARNSACFSATGERAKSSHCSKAFGISPADTSRPKDGSGDHPYWLENPKRSQQPVVAVGVEWSEHYSADCGFDPR